MKKIFFALMLLILVPTTILAFSDCPFDEVDCPYPGDCIRYIDADNNGICDHSQIALEGGDIEATSNKQSRTVYHLVSISLFLILLYSITSILSKKKIISIINHRKIWNILLLITFLISGLLGILLVININFGVLIFASFDILFWHVEVGIAMFVICIFHIIERWHYFKNLFKFN